MSKAPLFLPALPLASVRIALALAVLGGPLAAGSAGAGAGSPARWRPAPEPAGAAVAVAWDPATGRLAVADRGAVWVGPVSGPLEPVHREQGVTELVFGDDGALWIAGASGLHRWRAGGPSRALAPGPGVGGVTRVRAVDGWWLVAGADGLHRRGPDDGWARLDPGLPAEPVSALAVAAEPGEPGGLRLGAVVAGVAHWLRLAAAGGGAVRERARVGTPGDGPRAAVDVWITRDAGEAWTLLRDGCLVGPERVCAPLPPGAEAERVFHAGGRWWLATARGLLVAPEARGPWRRAPPPLGGLAIHAVAGDATTWLVGSERGLWVGGPEAQAGSPAVPADGAALGPALGAVSDVPAALRGERRDPPLEAVRRAALAYLDLGAGRLRAMRRGVEWRGWLPTLALSLDHDRDLARRDEYDEAYVSGGMRFLSDRQRDRSSAFEASLTLAWDFGDVLYHPESVDVSRETRALVELRDDVLDEIHHLYFERRRVLLELLALPEGRPLEAARLRLRADELAAGIDAWTGGWFGRHALRLAP